MKNIASALEELRFQLFQLEMEYESAKVAGGTEFAEFLTDYIPKRKHLFREINAKQHELKNNLDEEIEKFSL